MKFDSQICTTKEQSARLLALRLKKETADCIWCEVRTLSKDNPVQWHLLPEYINKYDEKHIPAWSLHRLIEMIPYDFTDNNNTYELYVTCEGAGYDDREDSYSVVGWWRSNTYDDIIDCIEWLIKEGYFNKEYLEE